MDPEHASIAGRLFFSQAENNQKAKRRKLRSFRRSKRTKRPRGAEKSFTARTAALRLSGRTRCAQTLPLREAAAMRPPRLLFSGRPPSGRDLRRLDKLGTLRILRTLRPLKTGLPIFRMAEVRRVAPLTDRDLATARGRSIGGWKNDNVRLPCGLALGCGA